jgi:hypothetical protein
LIASKPCLNTVSTFDNHSAQGKINFWQPFPTFWRGTLQAGEFQEHGLNSTQEKFAGEVLFQA